MTGLATRAATLVIMAVLVIAASACKEGDAITVRALRFHGVSNIAESELRAVLATKQGSRIPFTRKPGFNQSEFTRDLQRVKAFYADRGYPDAKVTAVNADFDTDKKSVALDVTIEEGQPVLVQSVRFEGFDVLPPRRQSALPRLVQIEPGAPRNRGAMRSGRETALSELHEFGYPYTEVSVREEAGQATRDVAIVYAAEPGPKANVEPAEFVGISR